MGLIRLIVSMILLPIMITAFYIAPPIVLSLLIALICLMCYVELLRCVQIKNRIILITGAFLSAYMPVHDYFAFDGWILYGFTFLFVVIAFAQAMPDSSKFSFSSITVAFFAAVFIPVAINSIAQISRQDMGKYLVLLPVIASSGTDIFAYIIGKRIGKHKLAPVISPKKSLEGAIAGVLGALVLTLLYGLALENFFAVTVSYVYVLPMVLIASVVSQIGDLSMSLIKREYGVKDFGTILPGHGGILDRFDSIIFVAPLMRIMLTYLPVITK